MNEERPQTVLARTVTYGPTLLLVAVALVQLWCALVDGRLTPAKGGGFGLFSTVDKLNNRHLRAYQRSAATGEEQTLRIPAAVLTERRLQAWEAKAFPREALLRSFARHLDRHVARPPTDALRVEVAKMTFDPATNEARLVAVADVIHPKAGGP